jgi:hypothetical protein
MRGSSQFIVLVLVIEIGHETPLLGCVDVGVLDAHLMLLVA